MKLVTAIAVALVSSSWAYADPSPPSAEEILRQIKAEGARAVLSRWSDTQNVFDKVCDRIESGEPDWLEVARGLKPDSDAASALSLNHSVARALPKAPERVLALVNHGFSIDDVCTSPFIEPEPGVAESYQRRAVEALRKSAPADLEESRKECLKRLERPLGRRSH